MTVDQAEAYSVPLIALISSILDKAGVKVDHESQSAAQTDFTALVATRPRQRARKWSSSGRRSLRTRSSSSSS